MGEEGGTGAVATIGIGTRTGVVRMGVGDKVHVSIVYIILMMC